MHCIDVVRQLVAFDFWANQLMAQSLTGRDAPPRAHSIFAHVLAAQTVWLQRIGGGGEVPVAGSATDAPG